MGSQVWVTIASESAYKPDHQASAIYCGVSATMGFMSAEPPMMARPRHQLSLGLSRYQHAVTNMPTAAPASR